MWAVGSALGVVGSRDADGAGDSATRAGAVASDGGSGEDASEPQAADGMKATSSQIAVQRVRVGDRSPLLLKYAPRSEGCHTEPVDFSFSEQEQAVADLSRQILGDLSAPERHKQLEADGAIHDEQAWQALSDAGLVGVSLPEACGGGGLGFLATCLIVGGGRPLDGPAALSGPGGGDGGG